MRNGEARWYLGRRFRRPLAWRRNEHSVRINCKAVKSKHKRPSAGLAICCKLLIISWLPRMDSNHDKVIQSHCLTFKGMHPTGLEVAAV
jgi:hypothetical protein